MTAESEKLLAEYNHALAQQPQSDVLLMKRGEVLDELGRPAEAMRDYAAALALQPAHIDAFLAYANALSARQPEQALAVLDRAAALSPSCAAAHFNRGNLLYRLRRMEEALASFDRALAIYPEEPGFHMNRAQALNELWRAQDALAAYDRAIALKPDYAEAYYNRGGVLREVGRMEEALRDYERAAALKPDLPYLHSVILHIKMHLCDWKDYKAECAKLDAAGAQPFPLVALPVTAQQQLDCAKTYAARRHPPQQPLAARPYNHTKLRVAFLSSDFHDHATARLMAGVIEHMDRSRFETYAFSWGYDDRSLMRARLRAGFSHFIDVMGMGEEAIARLMLQHEIDIALDLKGYTQDNRTGVFARRAAPVQAAWLGYPATMGAPYIDYLIADSVIIPPEDEKFYTEKVLRLPDCYQPNDGRRALPATPSRAAWGLPEQAFVFCAFNSHYKITPDMFGIWMRLLKQVEGSVLWLLQTHPAAMTNLQREAALRGVAAERLVFAPRMDAARHLARHDCADLFLDTLPCNAHTTASDALWTGLPLVTCKGDTFAGRVAASILAAAGVPELVTTSLPEYERLALSLAKDTSKLAALRGRLKRDCALFDTARYTKNFEKALLQMAGAP